MNIVQLYVRDLKVEAVKLQFQISSPHTERQHNDVLGDFNFNDIDGLVIMDIIKQAIVKIEMASTFEQLEELFTLWNKIRVDIQYQGYYHDIKRKSEAWGYVFVARLLKKKHKNLHNQLFGR